MAQGKGIIIGLLIFVITVAALIYAAISGNKKEKVYKIKMIEVTGNNLLSEKDYLAFTKLNDESSFKELTLPVIKSRFESHPYVEFADINIDGKGGVQVSLKEKNIKAVLLGGKDPYLISDNFEILPLFMNTKFSDVPVISNCEDIRNIKPGVIKKSDDLIEAFKIIDAARLTNPNMFSYLSEIDLNNGGDIMLSFSGLKTPVIFGKGNEALKMVTLEAMWDSEGKGKNILDESSYIDLRFYNSVYLGNFAQMTPLEKQQVHK
jgi:cell division septal protein FtsQ